MSKMTLGEVQDLLRNLRRVKQFYNRQIATIANSIREHEKIENDIRNDRYWNSTDWNSSDEEDDAAEAESESEGYENINRNRNPKRQKINKKIKIKVKKRI